MLREATGIRVEFKHRRFGGGPVYRVWRTKTQFWDFKCPNHAQDEIAQATTPVLIGGTEEKGHLWCFRGRYYWEADGLSQADVMALLVQREERKQKTLEKARAGLVGGDVSDKRSEAFEARVCEVEEQARTRRNVEERLAQVEGLNADVASTIAALETVRVAAIERDPSVDFDFENDDPETVASYFSRRMGCPSAARTTIRPVLEVSLALF